MHRFVAALEIDSVSENTGCALKSVRLGKNRTTAHQNTCSNFVIDDSQLTQLGQLEPVVPHVEESRHHL